MADVQGMGWAKYLHPDDYERYVSGYLAAAEKRALFESALSGSVARTVSTA